jgi:chromate reductase
MNDTKKKVLAICGSTRQQSANLQLLQSIARLSAEQLELTIYDDIAQLPHFNPDLDNDTVPTVVKEMREKISAADGVLICTPEYVFSLPGGLKNLIEWTVSTTVFSEKPVALITASGLGQKAHEALQLIMKTIYADVRESGQLLISGARSKLDKNGEITDAETLQKVKMLISSFISQMTEK